MRRPTISSPGFSQSALSPLRNRGSSSINQPVRSGSAARFSISGIRGSPVIAIFTHESRLVGPTEQGEPGVALGRGRGVVDLSAVDEGGHPAPLDDEPVRIPIAKLFDRRIEGQVGQRPTEMRPLEMLPVGPASRGTVRRRLRRSPDLPPRSVRSQAGSCKGTVSSIKIVGVPGVVQVFTAANRPSRDRFPLAASPVA